MLLRLLPDHVACIPPQTPDPKMHTNDSVAMPAPSLSLGSWVFCHMGSCIFRYSALSLSCMISGLSLAAKDLLHSTILEKSIFIFFSSTFIICENMQIASSGRTSAYDRRQSFNSFYLHDKPIFLKHLTNDAFFPY